MSIAKFATRKINQMPRRHAFHMSKAMVSMDSQNDQERFSMPK